jgi:predicted nucleic acid-binding protein
MHSGREIAAGLGLARVLALDIVKEDPTDNPILEYALAGGSEHVVTGDRHLLNLGRFRGTKIVTPADFLEVSAHN